MRKTKKQRDPHIGGIQQPMFIPASDWKPPTSLPDLRRVPRIGFDTEERDDGLGAGRGSGWPYLRGNICGVSAAWEGGAFYAPITHPDTECLDPDLVKRWVIDHSRAGVVFITHHGSHDWGWLRSEWGIEPARHRGDTEAAAMTVDENRLSYRLDDLCRWRGVPGKDESALREAAAVFGFSGELKANLWRMPARFVGAYAEQDAASLLPLMGSLEEAMAAEGTTDAYQLEVDLVPMVLEMRRRGIRVNVEAAHAARVALLERRDRVLAHLGERLGQLVRIEDCRSSRTLERWHQSEGITGYPRTPTTKVGSFSAAWMRRHTHWLPRLVARADQLTEAADKFIRGFIIDYAHHGRIHASINQFRGEEGGTRSYRFSYSDPALQQMHSRPFLWKQAEYDGLLPWEQESCAWDEEEEAWRQLPDLPTLIRGLFEPEEGEMWCSADYSQQEYRLIVHFAEAADVERASEAGDQYRNDPKTDFHKLVAEWTGLPRKPAKDTNFAKAFGAGVAHFAEMIGRSEEEARAIYEQYDERLPFVKQLSQRCQNLADRRGWIRLLDGARSHFDMWELAWGQEGYFKPHPREQALELAGGKRIRRAFTHKAMNRLIQGSAARQIKMAMRACWRENLVPLLQMHDELCFSVATRDQVSRVGTLMRDVVQLRVPMVVDAEVGPNWGQASHDPEAPDTWQNRRTDASNEERKRQGLTAD